MKYFENENIIDTLIGDSPTVKDPLEILRAYNLILERERANGLSKEELIRIMRINSIALNKLIDQHLFESYDNRYYK